MSTAAGLWREKESAGEGVAGQNSAKTRNGMYLRAREDPAKLRVALASAFVLGRGRLSPAAVALGSGQRWGEKAGSARGFIGRVCAGIRKGSSGFGHLPCGGDGGGFPCMAAPSVAEERKSPGEEKEARGRRKERRKGR